MKSDTFFINAKGKDLYARKWLPDEGTPNAVVLIIHGMIEHSGRYSRFAEALTKQGFAAYAYDHRGHGKTDADRLGIIDSDDSFHQMTDDLNTVRKEIQGKHPDLPLYFFAHSMGSFLTQRYMQLYENSPDGIIYSGSNGKPPILLYVGLLIANIIGEMKGKTYRSKMIHNLTFGPFNAMFKPNRTDNDWLSRDENEVDKYVDDPQCGFVPAVEFYSDFFSGLMKLHSHKPFAGRHPETPILIISGDQDPVSYMGDGIKKLQKHFEESGVADLKVNLYKGARHELLNETNRDEVTADVIYWLKEKMESV
ncbi:alpha/beta hydrolase [Rhodohalobacter sp. SW132]|uniref:alpha/beta hydrolase n=1 Tax=Rhodohalobacter sp. SW132 TaxID=2293433 RepID=UPI000E27D190|nr:alpha/beta hydrolase [Rhodohalobacter sp. SW132]REL29176.1 alpha/beta hydrolase [Rhodohalobacter sp. SW132]